MHTKLKLLLALLVITGLNSVAQDNIKWWDPGQNEFKVIEGQGWPGEDPRTYGRLPRNAEDKVREAVWRLSGNSAGVKIRFRTNSSQIKVRYQVTQKTAMPHMPATGVSGVDLYAKNSDGNWVWCRGRFSFGDTITFNFNNITPNDRYHEFGREYHLYLPLYNSLKWLEIGTEQEALFEPIPVRKEKPILVYGTSIAQGACASRPGMAWTNILERKMDNPIVNLGFSGNGRLETELIDYMLEVEARIYILDCLPNLSLGKTYTEEEVHKRIVNAVQLLRDKSNTPVLLVEHVGYGDATSNQDLLRDNQRLNRVMQEAFSELQKQGIDRLYMLTQQELALNFEHFVDGVHPNDMGMIQYAIAYEKKLRQIFNQPTGIISTQQPCTQGREPGMYNWEQRHAELLTRNRSNPPGICFFGNSITHYWGGFPEAKLKSGPDSWNQYLGDLDVQNHGFGWDRIENVLWRIYHEELDGFSAEQLVFMLGTNNLHLNTDEEIIAGLDLVIKAAKVRQQNARILLLGIYPRRKEEDRIHKLNLQIANLAGMHQIDFRDPGQVLLGDDNKIDESLFRDGLHPNATGYNKLGPILREELTKQPTK